MTAVEEAQKLSDSLGLTGRHVFFNDWVPYEERGDYLLESDLGVCTHRAHLETRFSFRTRLLDCVWAGLPVACTAGDEMGDLVGAAGMGKAILPEDVEGWVEVVEEARRGAPWYVRAPEIMASLRPDWVWERRLAPLEAYLRRPRRTSRGWASLPAYGLAVLGLLRQRIRVGRGV